MGVDEAGGYDNYLKLGNEYADKELMKYTNTNYTFENNFLIKTNENDNLYRPAYVNETYGGYRKLLENIAPENLMRNDYFMTNLYPFSRTNGDLTEREKIYFGFDKNLSFYEIIQTIKEYRFNILKTFFKTFYWPNKIIFFCIGNGISNIFPDPSFSEFLDVVYNPNLPDFEKPFDNISLKYDKESHKKFILPHASRNQINDEIIEIIKKIL